MSASVFDAFTLPSGHTLKNRLVKAAMEENMAAPGQLPGDDLFNLYDQWAAGETGLLITGNVMVDRLAMTGPGGVALERDTPLAPFKEWAAVAHGKGASIWMQINHPGRQVFRRMGGRNLAPSAVGLDLGKHSSLFDVPKAMSEEEIEDVIQRFADTAVQAQNAGFDGVEIHAAHGYLLAQFLSPLTNKRSDRWGDSLENRARLLREVVIRIRAAVRPGFAVAVKLNSADFQRGGFELSDAREVLASLEGLGVDLVELSGGSYESPAMQGRTADGRTLAREAYFLEFAQALNDASTIPLMVTGGVRRLTVAQEVLNSGVALVGMATALAQTPDLPRQWSTDAEASGEILQVRWKDKTLSGLANMAMVRRQLRRMGDGLPPARRLSAILSVVLDQYRLAKLTRSYRKALGLDQ
ncbi:NADH:flavin oxidoreductase/NADH oxidase family protein [Marinobacter alexandrii]|uniref:NADH:flavin oxidoreductase/NADH oxidase family protein n=1 Tax=Marinobacter alexandrii TaxID=2570351 RepID=UPI001FFFB66D|nr:NADH:flavin oxidoreductase/NADH oxidase family protein [Marinobacter alexandrii]MCK2151148.1 NADH:flavin oxidoreductase/NADH oxidase family protein [Marinobacter alexandrii]